jgi:AcrR family transcriptional regulator
MTRPAELTRDALIWAATDVFAEKGYEAGSVRLITQKAKANQAAINYHFGDKEGLYREVLRTALHAFDEFSLIDEKKLTEGDADEALRIFLRQQLAPLLRRSQLSRYLRLFNWEMLQRTRMFQDLLATERIPMVVTAQAIVERFLPNSSAEEQTVAMIWLVNQAYIFVRNFEHFSRPPTSIKVDDGFIDRLVDLLSRLLISGLAGVAHEKGPA